MYSLVLLVGYPLVVAAAAAAAAEHAVDVAPLSSADVFGAPAPLALNLSLVVFVYATSLLLSRNAG